VIQYGGPIRDKKGDRYGVLREGETVIVELQTMADREAPLMRIEGYPAVLQFIARLTDAAKEMAKDR
jgi:hypothetical protein